MIGVTRTTLEVHGHDEGSPFSSTSSVRIVIAGARVYPFSCRVRGGLVSLVICNNERPKTESEIN